jgi:plastocyanin
MRLLRAAFALALVSPAIAACAAGPDWSKAETVTVFMQDYEFVPDALTLRVGRPYRLHFVNRSKELHEFDAPQFLATAALGNAARLVRQGTELDVEPGKEKDLLVAPNRAGRFHFQCDDHEVFGMHGTITVE